jgi:fatty-acyl-CoA synthase
MSYVPGAGPEVHPDRLRWWPDPTPARLTTAGCLAAALVDRFRREPGAVAFYLPEAPDGADRLTVDELFCLANAAGATLAGLGVGEGDRICVCIDTSRELLAVLFGAALVGAVPMLAEPPLTAFRRKLWVERFGHMIDTTGPAALVVEEGLRAAAEEAFGDRGVAIVGPPFGDGVVTRPVLDPDPEAPALIQFSSGTTSAAKGVVLGNRALIAAADAIGLGIPYYRSDVMVSWLPLHHDMGMVGGTLAPFLHDVPGLLFRPLTFAMRPDTWLRLIHRYRGTVSPAPNFAYRLVSTRLSRMDLTGLDLSSWRSAFNGAEVVDAVTLRDWQRAMAPYGFRPESMRPCYGMAELGLAATFAPADTRPRITVLSRTAMVEEGRAERPDYEWDAQEYVSSGRPVPGVRVKIVGRDGTELAAGRAGRVLVASESMMTGYYGLPGKTAEDLRDGWLLTGDLGFMIDGELYVTGREKDLIIIAGRNYQPQPFEMAAATLDGVRSGGVAAIGVPDPERGTEHLVLVVESKHVGGDHAGELATEVERTVAELTGVRPNQVLIVAPGSVPKTSSGKKQRPLLAKMIALGTFGGEATDLAKAG